VITKEEIYLRLKERGLKVTPQRIAVLEVLIENKTHPNADSLIKLIRKDNPSISVGTIYNILDTLVAKGIIAKVMTEDNSMRYDPQTFDHHHIFIKGSDEIVDYFDEDLSKMVKEYLKDKGDLSEIDIERIDISIIGNRKNSKIIKK